MFNMNNLNLYESDYKLMTILWKNGSIPSGTLAKICFDEYGWKPSTTYTMIKKLSNKGFLENVHMTVHATIEEDVVQQIESQNVVKRTFGNSLPCFINAFVKGHKLTDNEVEEIINIIEKSKE